ISWYVYVAKDWPKVFSFSFVSPVKRTQKNCSTTTASTTNLESPYRNTKMIMKSRRSQVVFDLMCSSNSLGSRVDAKSSSGTWSLGSSGTWSLGLSSPGTLSPGRSSIATPRHQSLIPASWQGDTDRIPRRYDNLFSEPDQA